MIVKTLIAACALATAFVCGAFVMPFGPERQAAAMVGPSVDARVVSRDTVEYVDRPVEVVRTVEQVRTGPANLVNFSSLDELEDWLAARQEDVAYLQPAGTEPDCDDYALELQQQALANGYLISFEIISRSEYNALFEGQLPEGGGLHAINLAIIGNNAYYIEPQTNEVVLAAYLD